MLKFILLAVSAISIGAVDASASASQSEGTVTCEWTNKPYDPVAAQNIQFTFTRTSDNKVVVVSKEVTIDKTNSSKGNIMAVLRIKSPRATDVQNYVCVMTNGTENITEILQLRARPVPYTPTVAQTILDGQPFTFNCSCASSSTCNATKFKFSNSTGTFDLESSPLVGMQMNSSENSVLIAAVRSEHRGEYSCEIVNDVGVTSIAVRLRVKSPLAAVWPAIGILLEVIVLVVIVMLYERRRAGQKNSEAIVANDDDDDNGRGHNNTSGGTNSSDKKAGSGDVRQRTKA